MAKLVWYNGEVAPIEEAKVSAADHAHLYGDGLFEGIRVYDRRIFKLDEHLDRLYHGIAYLGFEMRMSQPELRAKILEVCAMAALDNGYIRLNVTRGTGLGLDPASICRVPNVMIMVNELSLYSPEAYQNGLNVVTSPYRVIPADALDPRVKCIGRYANNILAKLEANSRGAGEGLMLNHQGNIAEATGDNVFLVHKGAVRTPHASCGILAGVTRQTVINLARGDGLQVTEENLTTFDCLAADEAFLTGTAAEVIPMVTLDGRKIGGGKPGPVTKRIMELFRTETRETGAPF
jgi:branched-chain amino acid aminotransferase